MPTYMYPFDPTGVLTSNKIVDEQHILTSVNSRDYYTIVPKLGPIFENGLVVEYKDQLGNVRPLVKNIDYYLSNVFLGASRACMHSIYGSITLIDNTLAGVLNLKQYQTLGGEWVLDVNKWTQVIASMAGNPRTTTWEQIAGLPNLFPVIDHEWNLNDLVGMKEVVAQLRGIADVILATPANTALATHLLNMGNPHQTTKAHVGLGNVQNFGTASLTDLHEGASDKYITPIILKQRLGELSLSPGGGTTGATGPAGPIGPSGLSAYQVAVVNGFTGTEAQWLLALKGTDGAKGADGVDGSIGGLTLISTWTTPSLGRDGEHEFYIPLPVGAAIPAYTVDHNWMVYVNNLGTGVFYYVSMQVHRASPAAATSLRIIIVVAGSGTMWPDQLTFKFFK